MAICESLDQIIATSAHCILILFIRNKQIRKSMVFSQLVDSIPAAPNKVHATSYSMVSPYLAISNQWT